MKRVPLRHPSVQTLSCNPAYTVKFFNTAGPCVSAEHYMLPATERLPEADLLRLIEQKAYFVLHAPRQTGKTTALLAFARRVSSSGILTGACLSMEAGAAFADDIGMAENAILFSWQRTLRPQSGTDAAMPVPDPNVPPGSRVLDFLAVWAESSRLPLVLLLDEFDSLQDLVLISVLRQLRIGYSLRPHGFPQSICLAGLRDVRDYRVRSPGASHLHTTSPFNIAKRSLSLRDLSQDEVSDLLQQHTAETGQAFDDRAQAEVFRLTRGQPWLVNALAGICVEELVQDRGEPIGIDAVHTAREILIQRRQTHLDQLTDKLREERVRRVMEPLLAGGALDDVPLDDLEYVKDLGLLRRDAVASAAVANPIYGEVIPRVLASATQASLPALSPQWLDPDGRFRPELLLQSFLDFWRQHGQPLMTSAPYHEIAPHLVLMAFLHRVTNAHGRIEREYAVGSRRIDLCLHYGDTRMAMELKTWRQREKDPLAEGLLQLEHYLSGLGLDSGWLVIFDQRPGLPDISERTSAAPTRTTAGRQVTVIRA